MKAEIIQRIDRTRERVKKSINDFIIDSLTNCYNEIFLHEYLTGYIELMNKAEAAEMIDLIYINIDDIVNLNLKYSSKTGDETIANLGYVLKQDLTDDDMLFKKNGPGFIIMVHNSINRDVKKFAIDIQNNVKRSEAFIEPITVSTAVVSLSEIDATLEPEERAEKLLDLGQRRLNLTHRLGDNSYIDQYTNIDRTTVGRVLVIESDNLTLKILESSLTKNRFEVHTEQDGVKAIEIAKKIRFDAIIADRYVKKIDGLGIKQHLNESTININTLFILTSQSKNIEIVEKANHLRIDYVLKKPIIIEEIFGIISRRLETRENCIL